MKRMRSVIVESKLRELLESPQHEDMVPKALRVSPEFEDLNNFDVLRIWSKNDLKCDRDCCESSLGDFYPQYGYPYGGGNPFYMPMFSYQTSRGSSQYSSQSSQSSFASGNSQGAIDNRIEQAMDLVKSHLMNAVRSEVEELKEKIIGLETKIDHLQSENEILKAHAPSDVIQQLPQLAPTPPQMILAPPPAANNANMNNIMAGPPQPIAIQPPQQQQQQQPQQQQPVVSNGMINGHAHPQQMNNGPPTAQQN